MILPTNSQSVDLNESPVAISVNSAEVGPSRENLNLPESDGQHLPSVVVRSGHTAARPAGQQGKLLPAKMGVAPNHRIGQIALRSDVVIHRGYVVRQTHHIVKGVVAHRMMEQQEVIGGALISVDRTDEVSELGINVLREDLGGKAHRPEVTLDLEHLLGDRVAQSGAGVELVNGGIFGHFDAKMA